MICEYCDKVKVPDEEVVDFAICKGCSQQKLMDSLKVASWGFAVVIVLFLLMRW